MAGVEEAAASSGTQLNAALKAGVENISYFAELTFVPYVRVVLPLDGYVFWVRAGLLSASALLNVLGPNVNAPNEPETFTVSAQTVTVKGSLHYATDIAQDEDATYSINRVTFTSEEEIQNFNEISPDLIYIATFEGIRFAFSNQKGFYEQAGIWHYQGNAVYSTMEPQVIEDPSDLNTRALIVSNSLPIWLSLGSYIWPPPFNRLGSFPLKLFPSYLVDQNFLPPFGSVHIQPESTEAIAAAPTLGRFLEHDQLTKDRVRLTLYGLNNLQVLSVIDLINEFSLAGSLGIMNMPIPRDEKKTQVELNILAQKKVIDYEVNYLQSQARNIARQLITQAIPTYIPL